MAPVVGAAVDIMVSGFDGIRDHDLIKKNIIFMMFQITAMKSCKYLKAVVNRMVTSYTSPNWTQDNLLWQAYIRHDNHLTPKRQPQAKGLEQEYIANGTVINHMERQDAAGEVAPALSESVPFAAAKEMIAKARGETNALCIQLPMLEQFHAEFNSKKAVEKHTWPSEIETLINGPMKLFTRAV